MDSPISERSIVVAAEQQVFADLAGEAVVLNIDSGMYFGLNEIGARIWSLIQEPRTVNDVRDAILNEYEVEPDRCERDIIALLGQLADVGLAEVTVETVA